MTTPEKSSPGNGGADAAAAIRSSLRGRSDTEISPEDIPAAAANYRNSMNYYRRHGQECLAAGDYRQAAEKAWGAYASSVKSIAAGYGMRISFHGSIISVGSALASLAGQDNPGNGAVLNDGLGLARSLHQHFYENDLPAEQVIFSAERVAAAIDLMQRRFAVGGPDDTGQT